MTVGELVVNLFIKSDTSKLKDFIGSLSELRMSSLLNAVGLEEVYRGMKKVLDVANDAAKEINNFSRSTGQSAQEFQQWGKLAEQAGVSASVVAGSVTHLVDSVMRLKLTGEGSNFWNLIGIDPTGFKDDFSLLLEIAKKLDGLSVEEKRLKLGLLGLDPQLIPFLDYILHNQELIAQQTTTSAQQLEIFTKYNKDVNKLTSDWKTLLTDVGALIAPVADIFVNVLDSVVNIGHNFSSWIGPLSAVAGVMLRIFGLINPVARGLMVVGGLLTGGSLLKSVQNFAVPGLSTQGASSAQTNHFTFHINGNKDPKKVAEESYKEWEKQMLQDAQYQSHLPNN